jgi:hypothetical protein
VLVVGTASALALCGELTTGSLAPATGDLRTERMAFADCISLIQDVSDELGVTPVNILRTQDIWLSRIDAVDGTVTVTCSRPDSRLTLKRHHRREALPDGPAASGIPASRG